MSFRRRLRFILPIGLAFLSVWSAAAALPSAPPLVPAAFVAAQSSELPWVIWETSSPVQRLALADNAVWSGSGQGRCGGDEAL